MQKFPHIDLDTVFDVIPFPAMLMERVGPPATGQWRVYPLNQAAQMGYPAAYQDRQGLPFEEYFARVEALMVEIRSWFSPILVDGAATARFEHQTPNAAGSLRQFRTNVFRVRFEPEYALAFSMAVDVTEVNQMMQALRTANSDLEAQSHLIDELSVPVVALWDRVLSVPLVGALDSHRAAQLTALLLDSIAAQQAAWVIIDITGVPVVDTQVANYLLQAISAAQLLGCRSVLVGISPEIAQTIVQLGLDLSQITTAPTMQNGLELALRSLGYRITRS